MRVLPYLPPDSRQQSNWALMGVRYTANDAYPAAPPDPGGPITRWHYHDKSGGQALTMHISSCPATTLPTPTLRK